MRENDGEGGRPRNSASETLKAGNRHWATLYIPDRQSLTSFHVPSPTCSAIRRGIGFSPAFSGMTATHAEEVFCVRNPEAPKPPDRLSGLLL